MNDFRNAYALSEQFQWERNRAELDKANALLASGRFPVMLRAPAYCQFTDATLRSDRLLYEDAFASRAEAEARAAKLNAEAYEAGGWEGEFYAYPEPPAPEPAPYEPDEDIPW